MAGSGTKRWWIAATVVAVLGLLAVGAPAASAADGDTPADVIAAFSVEKAVALGSGEESGLGDLPDAASFGTVHRVHAWSASLIAGEAGDSVSAMDEWVAPVLSASGEAVGVYRVWRETPDSDATFAGVDGDAATAAALADVAAGTTVIEDPTIAAWYTLDAGMVTPVARHKAQWSSYHSGRCSEFSKSASQSHSPQCGPPGSPTRGGSGITRGCGSRRTNGSAYGSVMTDLPTIGDAASETCLLRQMQRVCFRPRGPREAPGPR